MQERGTGRLYCSTIRLARLSKFWRIEDEMAEKPEPVFNDDSLFIVERRQKWRQLRETKDKNKDSKRQCFQLEYNNRQNCLLFLLLLCLQPSLGANFESWPRSAVTWWQRRKTRAVEKACAEKQLSEAVCKRSFFKLMFE